MLPCPWPSGCKFLQFPCYSVLDLCVVSSSSALLQFTWPLGGKFFNRFVTRSLSFDLQFLAPCYSFLEFLTCKFFKCLVTLPLTFGMQSLQLPRFSFLDPWVWKSFNCLITVSLTFDLWVIQSPCYKLLDLLVFVGVSIAMLWFLFTFWL